MKQQSQPLAGPSRLILIQSGKYDYAELDLSRPFQLVGVNGLGKTALIATLQYLYLDSQKDMRFGQHSTDDSRRFYFKNDTSYILYECETSIGTVTLGARSLGPTSGYQLQRFAWKGGYNRADFFDEGKRPRAWDEVRPLLALKELQIINDTVELRRLLGAVDDETITSWGIVPLAEASDYPRFRQTFQRLLQLRDLRQDDLKQLLADCAKLAPAQREIDLATDFKKELEIIARDRAEIALLKKAIPLVKEVRGLHEQEYVARAIAHAVAKEAHERYAHYVSSFKGQLESHWNTHKAASDEQTRLEQEQREFQSAQIAASQAAGAAEAKLAALAHAKERFANFVLEIEEQARVVLDNEITTLRNRLTDLPTETIETITRQLAEKEAQLKQKQAAEKRQSDLFITWLRGRMSEQKIGQLGAIFDRRIFESIIDEQIHVADEEALLQRLEAITKHCDVRGYNDDIVAVEFAPSATKAASEIGKIARLQEDIRELERHIKRCQRDIETLKNTKPFRDRLPIAENEHAAKIRLITDYQRHLEELEKEKEYQTEYKLRAGETADYLKKLRTNEGARAENERQKLAAADRATELQNSDAEIRRQASKLLDAAGENPGKTPVSDAFLKEELPETLPLLAVFEEARDRCASAKSRADQLTDKISLIDREFLNPTFQYDHVAPVEKRLTQLETEIASIEERARSIENRWTGILAESRRSFHTLLKSLDAVKSRAQKLTAELAKIEFSSLAEIRLEIIPNTAAVTEYERHAKDSAQPSLFDTAEEADRKFSQFRSLLEKRPKLILNELYSFRCEVRRKDGLKNFYDNFDEVESTGTTIVLKVTLNLLVLRDLLVPGKARIPYYLDEVHALDRQNFNNILQLSERLGFVGIYAAPTAAIGPRRFVHLVPDAKGRLIVTSAHQKDIIRAPAETDVNAAETVLTPDA